jgi:ubiquitin-conjugating enzyme E2 O
LKLRLDGTVDITHPNGSTAIYPLSRLTKLYDSLEQFEDDGWEGEEGSDQGSHVDNAEGVWHLDADATWHCDHDDSEWEDEDSDEDSGGMDVDTWADENDIPLGDGVPDSLISRDVTPDGTDPVPPFPVSSSNTSPDSTQEIIVHEDEDGHAASPWKKFEILPDAPHDHAFYSSVSNQPSKNFLARLTKEYRALSTSLPGLYHRSFLTFTSHTNKNRLNSRPCVRGPHRSIKMPHYRTGEYAL